MKYYRHDKYLISLMRYLVFLVAISIFIANNVSAINNTSLKTNNNKIVIQKGGLMCGMQNGNYKKAQYVKPEVIKFTINASAYTASADECGKSDGITASGKRVKENHTLACPRGYEFGTKIHIEGMGTYICEDRGSAIRGNHFDIYMKTKNEAFAFGRRNLIAYVVS